MPMATDASANGRAHTAVIEARNITKYFGGVQALGNVSLRLDAGQILCLVGDNGAGKSTLSKILSGQLQPDDGDLTINGNIQSSLTARRALELGVSIVPQALALCDNLNASQNVMLGSEPVRIRLGPLKFVDSRRNRSEALERLSQVVNLQRLDHRQPVRMLSGGQRQAIAIVRAMVRGTSAIIFDEPTAALGVRQTEATLDLVRQVAARNIAVMVISHTLPDVMAVADRIVALRHGEVIMDQLIGDTDDAEVAAAMGLTSRR